MIAQISRRRKEISASSAKVMVIRELIVSTLRRKLLGDNQKLIKEKDDLVVMPLKLQEENHKLVKDKEDLPAKIESLNVEVKSGVEKNQLLEN
ncbi:unnamed protein product [Cochlearia groenlandica]